MKYWPLANVTVTVATEDGTVYEDRERSGLKFMDEEQKPRTDESRVKNRGWDSLFYRNDWVRSLYEALDFEKLKFPWIVVLGFLLMTVDDLFSESFSWVSDLGLAIAVIGAVMYIRSALRYARKKKGE